MSYPKFELRNIPVSQSDFDWQVYSVVLAIDIYGRSIKINDIKKRIIVEDMDRCSTLQLELAIYCTWADSFGG